MRSIRTLDLKKDPSVSETLDWARTLVVLGVESIDVEQARDTLHILLKYHCDIDRAAKELAGVDDRRTEAAGRPMLDLLTGFVAELRAAGIPVSLTEHLDAAEALRHVPHGGPGGGEVRPRGEPGEDVVALAGLRDGVRDLLRPARPRLRIDGDGEDGTRGGARRRTGRSAGGGGGGRGSGAGGAGHEGMTPEELADLLYKALLGANDAMVAAVARQAVTRYAGMEAGRPVGGTYYLYRTLRNLDLDARARPAGGPGPGQRPTPDDDGGAAPPGLTALEERLAARRVPVPHRPAAQGDRERDPPAVGGRPGQ